MIALAGAIALAAVVWLLGTSRIVDTKEAQARQQLMVLKSALERYRSDNGHYPSEQDGLGSLVDSSRNGKYLVSEHALKDPWGRPIVYQFDGSAKFTLYSMGPNGTGMAGKPGPDLVVHN